MTYTSNTPQSNQTIASTTTPIRNNFTFINTDLQVDHSFNGNSTGAEGTHLQCRMKGQASHPTLLANNNGAYYVDTQNNAQFWDGTNSYKMNLWRDIITGTVTIGSINTPVSIGASIPNQVFGELFIYGPETSSAVSAATSLGTSCTFVIRADKVRTQWVAGTNLTVRSSPIVLNYGEDRTDLKVYTSESDYAGIKYWWTLVYRNR